MKRIIAICLSIFTISCVTAFADYDIPIKQVFVNGINIDITDVLSLRDENIGYVPFRGVFEELGATVIWNELDKSVDVQYLGNTYLCETEPLEDDDIFYDIYMTNKSTGDWVQMNPMAADGIFRIINDKIYITQQSAEFLFRDLGCYVDYYEDTRILKITQSRVTPAPNATPVPYQKDDNAAEVFGSGMYQMFDVDGTQQLINMKNGECVITDVQKWSVSDDKVYFKGMYKEYEIYCILNTNYNRLMCYMTIPTYDELDQFWWEMDLDMDCTFVDQLEDFKLSEQAVFHQMGQMVSD